MEQGPGQLDQPEPELELEQAQQERTDPLPLAGLVSAEPEQPDRLVPARVPEQALGRLEQMDLLQPEAQVSAEPASEQGQRVSAQPVRMDQLRLAELAWVVPAWGLDQQASARLERMDRLRPEELASAGPDQRALDRLVSAEPDPLALGRRASAGPAWELGPLVSAELVRLELDQLAWAELDQLAWAAQDQLASAERVQVPRVLAPPVSAELALALDRLA